MVIAHLVNHAITTDLDTPIKWGLVRLSVDLAETSMSIELYLLMVMLKILKNSFVHFTNFFYYVCAYFRLNLGSNFIFQISGKISIVILFVEIHS